MRKKIFWKIHSSISTDISKSISEGKREKRARRYTCVASLHATVRCFPSICCNREISLSLIFCKFVNTTRKHNLKARIFIRKDILHIVPITLSISNSFLIWKKYFINFPILKQQWHVNQWEKYNLEGTHMQNGGSPIKAQWTAKGALAQEVL